MIYIMIFVPSQREVLQSLIHFTGREIYPDFSARVSRKYLMMCDQRAIKILVNTIQMVGILLFSNTLLLSLSGYAYIIHNEIQLPVPVLFPFTDLESVNGLIINLLNQAFLAFIAFAGLIGIEIATCILKDSIGMSSAAICYSIDEISEKSIGSAAYSRACIDRYFRHILMQSQDLDRYA